MELSELADLQWPVLPLDMPPLHIPVPRRATRDSRERPENILGYCSHAMNHEEGLKLVRKVIALEGGIRCKVCRQMIIGPCVLCAACETSHHEDCWTYGGGCAVFGCRKPEPISVSWVTLSWILIPFETLSRDVSQSGRVVTGLTLGQFRGTFLDSSSGVPFGIGPTAILRPGQEAQVNRLWVQTGLERTQDPAPLAS